MQEDATCTVAVAATAAAELATPSARTKSTDPPSSMMVKSEEPFASLEQLLHEIELPELADKLAAMSLTDAVMALAGGRPLLLQRIRQAGVAAGHAQRIANALARAQRAGRLPAMHVGETEQLASRIAANVDPATSATAAIVESLATTNLAALEVAVGSSPLQGVNALTAAVATGQSERVSLLLQARVPPDCVQHEKTVLALAASKGHHACVSALLLHKAQVDGTSPSDGCTPLLLACRRGHAEVASTLLAARAATAARARSGSTPLHVACASGHLACVSVLLDAGADVDVGRPDGSTPLIDACQRGQVSCVAKLLGAGASVSRRMHHGWSAMLVAALHGQTRCTEMLCEANAAVDQSDDDGTSAVSLAARNGHAECITQLCKAGASVNTARVDGTTPLMCAARGGHHAALASLIAARADLEAADAEFWTPLHFAAHHAQTTCIRQLLEARADTEHARPNGFTPLMAAAAAGSPAGMALLVGAGANLHRTKSAGCYIGDVWAHAEHGESPTECLRVLQAACGADGDADDRGAGSGAIVAAAALALNLDSTSCRGVQSSQPREDPAAAQQIGGALGLPSLTCNADGDAFVVFRSIPSLTPDESWQERPVRRGASHRDPPHARASDEECNEPSSHQAAADGKGSSLPPRLCYSTNARSPHSINIVHLILRDHGFCEVEARSQSPRDRQSISDVPMACQDAGGWTGWSVYWYGGPLDVRDVHRLLPHQKLSKFPGSSALTLKAELWRHFRRMQERHGTAAYSFMPDSYTLPSEIGAWQAAASLARSCEGTSEGALWIMKPNNASRSRGIKVVKSYHVNDDYADRWAAFNGVACRYVHPPCLLGGRKFDMRLFALVTSWHPLCIYLYGDGIARFATHQYSTEDSTLGEHFGSVHLTNFSLNQEAPRMMLDELQRELVECLGEEVAAATWDAVDDLVIKTFLMVEQPLARALRSCSLPVACGHPNRQCFQLFGLDIMIGADGKPWLLEVNLDPSMQTGELKGTPVGANAKLKSGMLVELFNLIALSPPPPRREVPPDSASGMARADALPTDAIPGATMPTGPPRRLNQDESKEATLRHINAELQRSRRGQWRRLLPSARSAHYEQFVTEEHRAFHSLPFDV